MTGLYTVNLRVMGRSNIPLLGVDTVFEKLGHLLNIIVTPWTLVVAMLVLVLVVKYVLDWFLHTEFGLCLQATGDNEQMIRALGTNTDLTRVVGLGVANGLVALSGSLVGPTAGVRRHRHGHRHHRRRSGRRHHRRGHLRRAQHRHGCCSASSAARSSIGF